MKVKFHMSNNYLSIIKVGTSLSNSKKIKGSHGSDVRCNVVMGVDKNFLETMKFCRIFIVVERGISAMVKVWSLGRRIFPDGSRSDKALRKSV